MPGDSPPRSGRPLTTSYADLMKPDEDWRILPNAAERRKIQNRLAQRAYRRNMRDRSKEVERLKKQIQQLQGFFSSNPAMLSHSPLDRAFMSGSRSPSSSENTPILHQAEPGFARDRSPHVNNYMQTWSHLHGPEQLNNLNLTSHENTPTSAAFDPASPYFSRMPNSNGVAPELSTAPNSGNRARDVITAVNPGSSPHHSSHRSHSMPTTFSPNNPNSLPWYTHAEGHGAQPMSAGFNMYSSPGELSPYHPESVYSLGDSLSASTTHSGSPDSELNSVTSMSSADIKPPSIARPRTSSLTAPFMAKADASDIPDGPKPLPETTAPLLHFAVAGGNLETLRLLLRQSNVNLNGKDSCGYTALQRAVMCGRTDMAAMLLEKGASQEGGKS